MVEVSVRPAATADARTVWEWRNDPQTRTASFQDSPIPLEVHRTWFTDTLDNPDRHLVIAEQEESIGVVRFDRVVAGRWTVHINLAPAARGRGLAAQALRAALRWLTDREAVTAVIAEIRADNERSQRAFAAAGFHDSASEPTHGTVEMSWSPTPSGP